LMKREGKRGEPYLHQVSRVPREAVDEEQGRRLTWKGERENEQGPPQRFMEGGRSMGKDGDVGGQLNYGVARVEEEGNHPAHRRRRKPSTKEKDV